MEPLFVSEHEYSVKELRAVVKKIARFNVKKTAVASAVSLIIGILLFVFSKDVALARFMSIVVITLGIIMMLIIIITSIAVCKQYKNPLKSRLEFYENEIVGYSETTNANSKEVYEYAKFIKVVKLKEYTLLYVNNNNAISVYNEGLNNAFFAFLKNKIKNFKE